MRKEDARAPAEKPHFVLTKEECYEQYGSAGVLVMSEDYSKILLGNHKEAPYLYGNFAGSREPGDNSPKDTAARELEEELGIKANPNKFGKPLIIIDNTHLDRQPKVAFVFPLVISENTKFAPPQNSEIKSVKWFNWNQIMALMDEHRPDLRLWGGMYTAEVLRSWTFDHSRKKENMMERFGGMVQMNIYHGGKRSFGIFTTPYFKLKHEERLERKRNNR